MFSIFHGLFTIIALGVDKYNRTNQEIQNKKMAKDCGSLVYSGARGNTYLVKNDRQVNIKNNYKGEEIITDMKTGVEYCNLTQMRKRERERKYLEQGKTVRFKMENECNRAYYGKYKQSYSFIDIESQTPVNDVRINGVSFYIELNNGLILRPVDGYKLDNKFGKWSISEIIDIINDRQNKIRDDVLNHDRLWIEKQFFFQNQYVYIDSKKNIHIYQGSPNMEQWKFIRNDIRNN